VIESDHVHLSVGPKENRTRPAINPLFRSAALVYGPRVIGVILSGILDDGTAGLWEIKRRGGIAVVQLPDDAKHKDMPKSAIANVHVDYQVPVSEMGDLLISLVGRASESTGFEVEAVMSEKTRLTCPDCHGPIERSRFGQHTEYKCRVGHTYSPDNMLAAHEDAEERAMWSAIESLEEGADLADELDGNHLEGERNALRGNAKAKRALARAIRKAVETTKLEKTDDR
jgi:two-component system chemotaxis response regulator CheB